MKCEESSFPLIVLFSRVSVFAEACLVMRAKEEGRSMFCHSQMNPGLQDLISLGRVFMHLNLQKREIQVPPHSVILLSASTTLVKVAVWLSAGTKGQD